MNQSLINQQPSTEKKKNIPSWVFGIFTIGMPILIFMGGYNFLYPWISNNYGIDLFDVSLSATFFVCIVSLISAIYGLIGIILCFVGLLVTLFVLYLNVIIMFTAL